MNRILEWITSILGVVFILCLVGLVVLYIGFTFFFRRKENERKGGWICVGCGDIVERPEGSMKHPYCKDCFKGTFNNDYDKYIEFLRRTH